MSVLIQKSNAVLELAQRYNYDSTHAHQVECIAGTLFLALQPLHHLGTEERKMLEYAAVLHDIGYFVSSKSHHRHGMQMVMLEPMPGFTREEKTLLANLVRYHRKTPPTLEHTAYAILTLESRQKVNLLAPILRIADALDKGRQSLVRELSVEIREQVVLIHVVADGDMSKEKIALERKADMFRQVYGHDIQLRVRNLKPVIADLTAMGIA